MKFLFVDVYEILRFAQDDKMEDRMTGWRLEGLLVSVSAILFLSYKIRADVLSSALIPLIR